MVTVSDPNQWEPYLEEWNKISDGITNIKAERKRLLDDAKKNLGSRYPEFERHVKSQSQDLGFPLDNPSPQEPPDGD